MSVCVSLTTGSAASWGETRGPEGGVAGNKSKVSVVTCDLCLVTLKPVAAVAGRGLVTSLDLCCNDTVAFPRYHAALELHMCGRLETPMSRQPHFYIFITVVSV